MSAPNTHYAMVVDVTGTSTVIIAAGSEEFCRGTLEQWLWDHPLAEGETAEVLTRDPAPDINED